MPLSRADRIILNKLCREYKIVFIDELPVHSRPASLAVVFNSIDNIKSITYHSYRNTSDGQNPFAAALRHAELMARTHRLVEAARDCVARIEETWRFDCETLVLQRLTHDATCLRCRQRVRRSDIEDVLARTGFMNGRLNDPQGEGRWCSCPPNTQPNEENMRTGLERTFIGRASELVNHPSSLAKQLRRKLHPDRVYGLRETRQVGEILQTPFSGNSPVQDLLAKQPHSFDGKPLLFPFLVVEAKGSKASDDWHSICLQTAFPIYTFLNVQQSLRAKAGHQLSGLTSGPLVWFIMSRGEDWRVYLAYHGPTRGVSGAARGATNVVRVWVGCITNLDSALQLLLMVECLSDWARDFYRPAVLRDLETVATPGIKPDPGP